jgi:hypothetical protein
MLASPIKDASNVIKTAFLLIRRLRYKSIFASSNMLLLYAFL